MNERVVTIAVAAVLAACAIWLAIAAAGGGTTANAGRDQFYPGPVCRVAPSAPSSGEGCPRLPPPARGGVQQRR